MCVNVLTLNIIKNLGEGTEKIFTFVKKIKNILKP